ncbi:MAG: hypothetical protein AAGC85_25655, partial [Bacteroidota bacterium]
MMDLEIWLDLAVGIIALGAVGFGAWVYFASQNGKEVSLPKINVKLPSLNTENKVEVRKKLSGSVNRLLGREEENSQDYMVPEEDPLIVPIKSTTLPSNRKLDLDDLYDKAKAFDEAEENEVDVSPVVDEPSVPKVQLAVPVSPIPEKPVEKESLEETVAETPAVEGSTFLKEQEEVSQAPVMVELPQENVIPTVEEEISTQVNEQAVPEVEETSSPEHTATP